jgi:hypothetical protein
VDQLNITGVSASLIKTHKFCNWKAYLSYVLKIEDPAGPSAFVGTVVHNIMEEISKMRQAGADQDSIDIEALTEQEIKLEAEKNPSVFGLLKPADITKIYKIRDKILDNEKSPNLTHSTVEVEKYFKYYITRNGPCEEERGIEIRGLMDRVELIDHETLEIIDYKTGKRRDMGATKNKELEDMYYDPQYLMYFIAASIRYKDINNFILTFMYPMDGGNFSLVFSRDHLKEACRIVYDYYVDINNDKAVVRNRGWWCKNICFYGQKTGICDDVYSEFSTLGQQFVELKYSIKKTEGL